MRTILELNPYTTVSSYMYSVYAWMSIALTITATVAYIIGHQPRFFITAQQHPSLLIVVVLAQIGVVIVLNAMIARLNFVTAMILFLGYAALVGVTVSLIFYLFTTASIVVTFVTAASMFAVMATYGYCTKHDLTSMGNMLFMAVVGLIIGGIINMLWQNSFADMLLSGIGVVVFTLLTAYDVQKIKQFMMQQSLQDNQSRANFTIIAALMLYTDFINLFMYLLRFTGRRRQS